MKVNRFEHSKYIYDAELFEERKNCSFCPKSWASDTTMKIQETGEYMCLPCLQSVSLSFLLKHYNNNVELTNKVIKEVTR